MNDPEALKRVHAQISEHLNAIGALFKDAKITLIVRLPELDDADCILTSDDLDCAVDALRRLQARGKEAAFVPAMGEDSDAQTGG